MTKNHLAHPLQGYVRLYIAPEGHRNLPRLFRHYDRQGIGFFRDSDGCAMARSQSAGEARIRGEWKKTGGSRYA
jgi:hypothetical protein